MGRPINYKKRGGPDAGKIRFQAHFTGEVAAENAWLNRQVGSNSYELVAEADDSRIQIFELTDTIAEGFATLTIQPAPASIYYEADAVTNTNQDSPVTTLTEGDHIVLVVGGDPIVPASVEITIDALGDVTGGTIVSGGQYPTDVSNVVFTLDGVDGGVTVEFDFVMGGLPATKLVQKLTQHRAVTYDGYAFKVVDEITEPTIQGVLAKIS